MRDIVAGDATEIVEDIPTDEVEAQVDAIEADTEAEGNEKFTVTIEGEEPEEEAAEAETPVIRTLRQKLREAEKKAKALEREKNEAGAANKAADLPPRPKQEDFDYDDTKFAEALEAWIDQKKTHDAAKKAEKDALEATQREFHEREAGYNTRKAALGADDFGDAEAAVDEAFSVHQRGMIIDATDRPEIVVYALGTKPKLAAELAKIANPVRFIAEIVRLEGKLKVSTSKPPPAPEKRLSTSGGAVTGTNQQIAKLKADADASGDYTAYFAAKRKAQG